MGDEAGRGREVTLHHRDHRLVVETLGVSKRFGATYALRGIDLAIEPGQTHALVGRNGAGKSTLVGLLTGLLRPDEGQVLFDGQPAPRPQEREKWREHVSCVYQRSTIFPDLTVAENLFLGCYPDAKRGLISWRSMRSRAQAALDEWDVELKVDLDARWLSVEQRQVVEIVRALSLGARFMILDEPTAELENREVQRLFERVRRLQETGVTFLYISHHLEEVFEICQTVTVLRDGQRILTAPVAETTEQGIVSAMVGEEARLSQRGASRRVDVPDNARAPALEVRDLGVEGHFSGIDLEVRPGECVGLAGLGGSGMSQVVEAVAGIRKPDSGEIRVAGTRLGNGRVDEAIEAGVGYIPPDRHASGFVPYLGVAENATMTIAGRLGRLGFVGPKRRSEEAERLSESLQIVASSQGQPVSELSGGNQQKVVMARALASKPWVLVLANFTSGVDVASKEALYSVVEEARRCGTAVLVASDEIEELRLCERILVMFRGRLVGRFESGWRDEELVATIEGVGEDGQ